MRFVRDVEGVLLGSYDADTSAARLSAMNSVLRYVTDWQAWHDNQATMDCLSSLSCTRDLLLGRPCDGRLPFLHLNRSVYQTYAMHLPAGVTYLLGHQYIDATCPWCRDTNFAVSIPHLLRDCVFWAAERQDAVSGMHQTAITLGIMSADTPSNATEPSYATLWYHLMVGRPVPYRVGGITFFDLPLFHCMAPDAQARLGRRPAFGAGALSKYARVLRHAHTFVISVLSRTQRVFGAEGELIARNIARAGARLSVASGIRDPEPLSGPEETARQAARAALRRS